MLGSLDSVGIVLRFVRLLCPFIVGCGVLLVSVLRFVCVEFVGLWFLFRLVCLVKNFLWVEFGVFGFNLLLCLGYGK